MDTIKVRRGTTGPWFITRLGYLPPHGTQK